MCNARLLAVAALLLSGCYQTHVRGSDAGPRPDTGPPIDSGAPARCDEETLTAYTGPPCSDAVTACRSRCADGDEPCRDACIDAPCRSCIYGTIFPCANELGCEPAWRSFACCVESVPGCEDLRGFDRTTCATSCPMRFEPYAMCIESMAGPECFLRAARNCGLR